VSSGSHTSPLILIANDQEWTARSLESILVAEGYEVIRAFTGRQAIDRALQSIPDLVILDTQLPDLSGPEVCRALREHPALGWGLPIILTTAGSSGRSRQADALEAGAWDFMAQPFDGPLLLVRIRNYLRAKRVLDEVREDGATDPATGLYNRRGIERRLAELAVDAKRRGEPLTCLAVSAGSTEVLEAVRAADELGRAIGKVLRQVLRGSDVVARVGPLDFVIVAPTVPRDMALQIVCRLEAALVASRPADAPPIPLRAGVASAEDVNRLDPEDLLGRALAAVEATAGGGPDEPLVTDPTPGGRSAAGTA
jgi:diguanylate cyclase (GGDEF)-like protein